VAHDHSNTLEQLTHQLRLSPVRLRLRQFDAIEYLVDLIEAEKSYPYEFICHQITGYRPKDKTLLSKTLAGRQLIEDLVQMLDELSSETTLPVGALRMACWSTDELARRLNVSTKTICRWRKRGLPGRKLRYPDGTVKMAFLERSVRRFVSRHKSLVKRGAAFKQLRAAEKKRIVQLAKTTLSERRLRLHELSQHIAAEVGRAVETVRYTLRRYDEAHPEEALFAQSDQPVIPEDHQTIYDAYQAGESAVEIARRHGRTPAAVEAIIREVRARMLKAMEIQYVSNAEFELPSADETILSATGDDETVPRRINPPRDLPPYLQELYRQPLFSPEQERNIFRRYNYLKFKADRLRDELDEMNASQAELDEIERLLEEAEHVKNRILKANLRLVVSIARRHVGRSPHFFEIVSDGNLSLMRAVEKFDYARGFKFSTYASWAIMRNYARTIPEQMYHTHRLVTGSEEVLGAAPAREDPQEESVMEAARHLVKKGLGMLTPRERDVVVWHFGLGKDKTPRTLDQIGKHIGVTKERVRQIERKAMEKLRRGLKEDHPESLADAVGY